MSKPKLERAAKPKRKTVFLDRDGVLNVKPKPHDYVKSWREFRPLPGVPEAVQILKKSGWQVVVVTNQRGVARKLLTEQTLTQIHERFNHLLAKQSVQIDKFYYCPHEEGENCDCRKPKPGMFLKAIQELDIDVENSLSIGDSSSDELASKAVNLKFIKLEANGSLLELVQSKIVNG